MSSTATVNNEDQPGPSTSSNVNRTGPLTESPRQRSTTERANINDQLVVAAGKLINGIEQKTIGEHKIAIKDIVENLINRQHEAKNFNENKEYKNFAPYDALFLGEFGAALDRTEAANEMYLNIPAVELSAAAQEAMAAAQNPIQPHSYRLIQCDEINEPCRFRPIFTFLHDQDMLELEMHKKLILIPAFFGIWRDYRPTDLDWRKVGGQLKAMKTQNYENSGKTAYQYVIDAAECRRRNFANLLLAGIIAVNDSQTNAQFANSIHALSPDLRKHSYFALRDPVLELDGTYIDWCLLSNTKMLIKWQIFNQIGKDRHVVMSVHLKYLSSFDNMKYLTRSMPVLNT